MTFNGLHKNSYPLILCNVWVVNSAKIAEKIAFQAIGTSSAAIASMLGYDDGEKIQFEELCYVIQKLQAIHFYPSQLIWKQGMAELQLK